MQTWESMGSGVTSTSLNSLNLAVAVFCGIMWYPMYRGPHIITGKPKKWTHCYQQLGRLGKSPPFSGSLVMMGRLLGRAYMLPHSFDSCSKTGMMIMLFHLMGIATLSLDTPRFSKTATSGSSLSTRVLPILISTWQPKKPCRGHHQLLCRLRDNGIETIQISVILCSGTLAGSIP